ncbi:hypothetical protein BRD00_04515 [Halobacteriales archaeon QS_8_69_26]|nr:MAG: hypothetical protein BRD00_04515 [Halobacteriales archaeon QS_8_69_26]
MAAVTERVELDEERAWAGGVLVAVSALAGGSVLFPKVVWDGFLWKYFWGPVYADAHGARCAWRAGEANQLGYTQSACAGAPSSVAFPGYTLVSEVGYAVTLIVALVGVAFLLQRLRIERYRAMFFALFPFVIFGGALRVVEDVNDAVFAQSDGAVRLIAYPLNTLLISPVIYFTVFVVAVLGLVLGVYLDREGYADGFETPLAAVGTTAATATIGILAFFALTTPEVSFYPAILLAVVAGSVVVTLLTWEGIERFAPELNAGTGTIGLLVILGQAVDGVANVVGLDWTVELGAPGRLSPKHPVNAAVRDFSRAVFPAEVTNVVGVTWPFLLLKVVAAVFIVWIFNEEVFEDSPRFAIMLLLAALAVGLGPGTRDALRATFWV